MNGQPIDWMAIMAKVAKRYQIPISIGDKMVMPDGTVKDIKPPDVSYQMRLPFGK